MQIEQRTWTEVHGWTPDFPASFAEPAQLILVFGAPSVLRKPQLFEQIRRSYPQAHILGCSTAGEICGIRVSDNSLVITAIHFQHTFFRGVRINLSQITDSFQAGKYLAQALPPSVPSLISNQPEELGHVLVFSDGLHVNGSDLVRGLTEYLPERTTVTGGFAGDGSHFKETFVFWDELPATGGIAALGLYGKRLRIGFGSMGGWDSFGPERLITRSKGNILYEMDGQSALGLYKRYLGGYAKELPATGLLFPLSIRTGTGKTGVVRTILSVDEHDQSMTFAGDVPEGAYARLMKANVDRLIDGAVEAAHTSCQVIGSIAPDLALLISCIGRKLVLRQRVEEEIEGIRDVLGEHTFLTGFYSYGEISPFTFGSKCELHNQTMTITTFSEE